MPTEILEFRKKPILKITQENNYTKLYIGIKKARLILEYIKDIEDFVSKNKESPETLKEPSLAAEGLNNA